MFDKIIDAQIKYGKIILIFFFLILIFFASHAVKLPIDPSFSVLVSPTSEFNTNERILSNTFETNNAFTILLELDPETKIKNRPTTMQDETVTKYAEDIKRVLEESQYVKTISPIQISDDEQYARIILGVDVPRKVQGERDVLEELNNYLDEVGTRPGIKTTITGFPVLLNRVNTLLINDNLKAILFTLSAIFAVLFWYFKDARYSLLAISIPLSSLIILAGTMSILNIPLTITLAAIGILVLGLGIDYTIHVLIAYNKEIKNNNKPKAIHKAIDHITKAIFVSYATTVAGFSALMFGVSPSSQSQGIVLSIGITIIFLVTTLIIPATLNTFGRNREVKSDDFFKKIKKQLIKLSKYQAKKPKIIITIVIILSIIFIFGATKIEISTDNNNWAPDDDPISRTFRTSAIAFGTDFDSITLVLKSTRGDFLEVNKVREIQELEKHFLSHKDVTNVDSPFTNIELERSKIIEELNQKQRDFNQDFTLTRMTVQANDLTGEDNGRSTFDDIQEMAEEYKPFDVEISYFGDTIRFRELGASLGRDTGITTVISFLLVFLIASIAYIKPRIGLVALLPVLIGVIWSVGILGFIDVPFTALSTGLIALVLGIGVDFSIHLVNSIYKYLDKGKTINYALEQTLDYTGTPILLSSITTFIGFISLIFATLLGIQRLGISLAISILAVFIVTITLVPAIISISYKKNLMEELKQNEKNNINNIDGDFNNRT